MMSEEKRQNSRCEEVPPPPPVTDESVDNNLTISTKLSTDQLICKTPRDSPVGSMKNKKIKEVDGHSCYSAVLYLAVLQLLFGLLMCAFGILVVLHDASLAQLGGGLWGGCLAVGAGTSGILAAAKNWCPLRIKAQKVAQTVFLALSLISLAISQLVVVLAATGLARDVQKTEIIEIKSEQVATGPEDIVEVLPSNYPALISNVGLLLISALECICAAIASYKAARAVCPCFKSNDEDSTDSESDNFVSSWLGKHTPPHHVYLVHAPSSIGKHNKMSGGLPVFALPQPMIGPSVYPLIPAPLGAVPSPIIPITPRDIHRHYRRYLRERTTPTPTARRTQKSKSRSRSQSKEKQITAEDVARTYTGLDRTIAEEFIEICDSRNNSLCSNSSCRSGCSQSGCTGCTSDIGSRDYLIEKI